VNRPAVLPRELDRFALLSEGKDAWRASVEMNIGTALIVDDHLVGLSTHIHVSTFDHVGVVW
jgi:hypothetical protein